MAHISFVIGETWPVWEMSLCSESKAAVHKGRCDASSIVTSDLPLVGSIVPSGAVDTSIVNRVLADVENAVQMLEVSLQLYCARILLCPFPSVVYLWDGEGVDLRAEGVSRRLLVLIYSSLVSSNN